MIEYRDLLAGVKKEGRAVGHFNFASFEMLWGIVDAARELDAPVILGLSEGERDWVGSRVAVAIVRDLRERGLLVYLNADHTYSFERVKEAIDSGFDSVIFDGAKLPMDENIKITKECVEYARTSGRDVLVEGELGYIGEGSVIRDALPEGVQMTTVQEAKRFVEETGVDIFAPAVGNVHGMLLPQAVGPLSSGPTASIAADPPLDTNLIKQIAGIVSVPLVLHGGSGTPNLKEGIEAGISLVHISTELRRAWHEALKKSIESSPDELAPHKLLAPARVAVKNAALLRLQLFNSK